MYIMNAHINNNVFIQTRILLQLLNKDIYI